MQENCKARKINILRNRAFLIFLAVVVITAIILVLFIAVLTSSEKIPKKATYVFLPYAVNIVI